jgi:Cupin
MPDPLSEVLRSVRLVGGLFLEGRFTAPWSVFSRISPEECRPFMTVPGQVIGFHVVIDGRLLITVEGQPPIEICAGEIVLRPRNDTHTLASAPGISP